MNETATARPLLISARELAALLGVSVSTIWVWHSSGRVPLPVRVGGCTKWRRAEVEEWVKARCPGRARWMERTRK